MSNPQSPVPFPQRPEPDHRKATQHHFQSLHKRLTYLFYHALSVTLIFTVLAIIQQLGSTDTLLDLSLTARSLLQIIWIIALTLSTACTLHVHRERKRVWQVLVALRLRDGST